VHLTHTLSILSQRASSAKIPIPPSFRFNTELPDGASPRFSKRRRRPVRSRHLPKFVALPRAEFRLTIDDLGFLHGPVRARHRPSNPSAQDRFTLRVWRKPLSDSFSERSACLIGGPARFPAGRRRISDYLAAGLMICEAFAIRNAAATARPGWRESGDSQRALNERVFPH
jgi:hypothetical protein